MSLQKLNAEFAPAPVRALLVDLLIELARTRTVGPYSEKMRQVIAAIVNQYSTVTIEKLGETTRRMSR